jgi:hypothetical protein
MKWMMLACELRKGLRPQEASAKFIAADGIADYMPVDRSICHKVGKQDYVEVSLCGWNEEKGTAWVILPVEAASGRVRLWVPMDSLRDLSDGVRA